MRFKRIISYHNFAFAGLFGLLVSGAGMPPAVSSISFGQSTSSKPTTKAGASGTTRNASNDSNLLSKDYYAGVELLSKGACLEAFQAFERAYLQARQNGESRGIDSVPPLVMMGECLYLQGDSGSAMQHFDAGLSISIACRNWLSLIQGPIGREKPDTRQPKDNFWAPVALKGIPYFNGPKSWTIRLGTSANGELAELQSITNGSATSASATSSSANNTSAGIYQVDALEILRAQSIALRRRYKILGPLAKHNPLSDSLAEAFRVDSLQNAPEELQLAAKTCFHLSRLGIIPQQNSIQDLSSVLISSGGFEHPLTASARLAISRLAAERNDMRIAGMAAMDATLSAARAQQFLLLDEATELWSSCAYHNNTDLPAVTKILKDIQTFAQSPLAQSPLAQSGGGLPRSATATAIRAQVELLRQAAYRSDRELLRQQISVVTGLLQPQAIELPRMEAVLLYSKARLAFLDGNAEEGLQFLAEAMNFMRGATPLSSASAPLYQLNLTLRLLTTESISNEIASSLLRELLDTERQGAWKISPLEELVFLTHDKIEARRAAVLLALNTDDLELQLQAWEAWKAARILHGSVFNGRLTEMRRVFHSFNDFQKISSQTGAPSPQQTIQLANYEALRAAFPALTNQAQSLKDSISQLTSSPKWDTKKWSEDDKKKWDAVQQLCKVQELALWNAVCAPLPVGNAMFPAWKKNLVSDNLSTGDAVLAFYSMDGEIYGYSLVDNAIESWRIEDSASLETDLRTALSLAVRIAQPNSGNLSADATSSSATVSKSLTQLRNAWVPDDVWRKLLNSDRWIISPDGFLWDIPIEMMPTSATDPTPSSSATRTTNSSSTPLSSSNSISADLSAAEPVIQSHRVCYTPTLTHIPHLFPKERSSLTPRIVDVAPEFVSTAANAGKAISNRLNALQLPETVIDTAQGTTLPPPLYTKLAAKHFVSLREHHWTDPNKFALMVRGNANSVLADWTPLPWGVPKHLWLLGQERERLPSENIIEPGDEWLRWTSSVISQGTQGMLISRWSVGGESTLTFADYILTNLEDSSFSEALQRSILTLWTEEFDSSEEPFALKQLTTPMSSSRPVGPNSPSAKELSLPKQINGSHPALWGSYMLLGDSD